MPLIFCSLLVQCSSRDELYEARRAITLYDAVVVSVRGHGGKKCAAPAVSLADLVGQQVRLAQEQGMFNPPPPQWARTRALCWYARTPRRCGGALPPGAMRLLGFWPVGPANAGIPHNWIMW